MNNAINWFPGHMAKSLRVIREDIALADAVVYVLDARAALSSLNPELDLIAKSKPVIYAVNKADLISEGDLKKIMSLLTERGKTVVSAVSTAAKTAQNIVREIKNACNAKIEKYAAKGVKARVRAMVVGVPNGGKSTLINSLVGEARTVTGNKPGVTRGKQWVRVNDWLEVLDTPGTLYPKLGNQIIARRLAYIGSIKDDVLDVYELALSLVEELDSINPSFISQRYKIDEGQPADRLAKAASSRGLIKKGGAVDEEKAAVILIDDFRKGRLGKIALETNE